MNFCIRGVPSARSNCNLGGHARQGKRELAMRHRHPAMPVFGGFLALAVAIGIGRFAYTPILPYMVEGLGISKSEAGLLASANFLGYLSGALGAASAAVPGSRRFWLLSALATSAVTTMAMALTEAIHLFLVFRFAGGVASALVMVFGSALILDRLPARPERAAGLYAGVGFGISALTVSGVASNDGDWQRPWAVSGIVSACAVAAICRLIPRQEERPPPLPEKPTAEGEGAVRQLVIAYGLFGFGYVVTATFVSDMMRENSLLRPAEHMVWLCVGLAAVPSVALWMRAVRRWGSGRSFAVACLLEAAGVALSALGDGLWLLLAAAGLLGGTFMGITALGLVHARLLSAGDSRRVLALMTASFGIGQMVGPLFGGVAYDLLDSYAPPSQVAAAALVAAAILAFRLPLSGSRRIAGLRRTSSGSRQ